MMKILDKLYRESLVLKIDDTSKLVIMSDCHRGIGDASDNFSKNQNIYAAALKYYYNLGYTYFELGDGDEMWEVENYQDIVSEHLDTFKMLKKFNDEKRLLMIYGNHDILKSDEEVLKENYYTYYNKETKTKEELLTDLKVYESLILDYQGYKIFLLHGHQIDLLNGVLWRLARFLVRHLWRPLENFGIKDPTSAAKNYSEIKKFDKKLKKWSGENNIIVIAGHTHRPIFPKPGESMYFNDGSCVHPNGITCIEINKGEITLAKWELKLNNNNTIGVKRTEVEGSEKLVYFYS